MMRSMLLGLATICVTSTRGDAAESNASLPSAATVEAWTAETKAVAPTQEGCFEIVYPGREWIEVPCIDAPVGQLLIGGGQGAMADAFSARFWTAEGTLTQGPIGSESDSVVGADAYSIQLNTNTFVTGACASTASPSTCKGWNQFVYLNKLPAAGGTWTSGVIYFETFLVHAGLPCPPGFANQPGTDSCYDINGYGTSVPIKTAQDIQYLTLYGRVNPDNNTLTVYLGQSYPVVQGYITNRPDSLGLGPYNWTQIEFNVFGYGGCSTAQFTSPTTLKGNVNVTFIDGLTHVPICHTSGGHTCEFNNLNSFGSCFMSNNRFFFYENN